MKKVLSSIVVAACASATFGAFAQSAQRSETTVEQSTTVQVPQGDVKVDEKRSTTTTTTRPAPETKSKSKTTTTTTERNADGVEVKSRTKTETEKRY